MGGMCLVTGAAGGIGKSIVSRLAQDGYRVLAADLSKDAADAALAGVAAQLAALHFQS